MAKKSNEFSLGEAIELYLNENGIKEKSLVQRVIADWEKIMGKPVADHTEQLWWSKGVFHIKVSHPAWKNELSMSRSKIKDLLNKELGASLIQEVKIV
ncbi:MAG: DUF721 domain-containing protein [Bacteroidia bacterium]|nr:DUF721 domain-containing protein [Bacteroidia bacterium]